MRGPRKVVLTNGCFDMLHPGHVFFLQQARGLGDWLMVLMNGDESVRALKGPSRPVYRASERLLMLRGLRCVNAVIEFKESPVDLIYEIKPAIYVKGGDYSLETLDPDEREALHAVGADIVFIPTYKDYSTTKLCQELQY